MKNMDFKGQVGASLSTHLRALRTSHGRLAGVSLALMLTALDPASAGAAVGGLGTTDQIRLEALAKRVLATPEVQEARRQVKELFRGDPVAATEAGRATLDEAVQEILFAAIVDTVAADPSDPAIVWTINAPHQWFDTAVPGARYGIDNPDNVYRFLFLDGAARYEIKGRRPAVGPVQFGFELLDSAPGIHGIGKQIAFLAGADLKTDADGSFTVTIGPEPAGNGPNHIQSTPAAKALLIRDTLSDWGKQAPTELEVHRLGAVDSEHPGLHQLALAAARNAPVFASFWLNYRDHSLTRSYGGQVNAAGKIEPRAGGWGFAAGGQFQLAPDEALVVTVDPRGAGYVGFQLADPWTISTDYIHRLGSLNNHQAVANPDGSITYVISVTDPGVHNWLDPSGLSRGFFQIRWQQVPSGKDMEGAIRGVKLVKLAELPGALPPGTKTISPADRAAQLVDRHSNYRLRLEN